MESWRACTCHNEPVTEDFRPTPHCRRSGSQCLVWWIVECDAEREEIKGVGSVGCEGLMWDECEDAHAEAWEARKAWERILKVIEREGVGPRKKKDRDASLFP